MILIDSGIGGTIESVNNHINNIVKYLQKKDTDNAVKELTNYHQSLIFVYNSISPESLSFAALIHSINDKVCHDISDEGLKKTLTELKKVPYFSINNLLVAVKKKLKKN